MNIHIHIYTHTYTYVCVYRESGKERELQAALSLCGLCGCFLVLVPAAGLPEQLAEVTVIIYM